MVIFCSVCESDHCPETNMDGTVGCCICYNKQMVSLNEIEISLCKYCKRHKKYKGISAS